MTPDLRWTGQGRRDLEAEFVEIAAGDLDPTFVVDQVADNDDNDVGTHAVRVTLTPVQWRQVVGDIARAVYRGRQHTPLYPLLLAAGRPTNDVDRVDALTRLVQRLGMDAPSWELTPERAAALVVELDEAAQEPASCESCGRFIEQPSELTVLTGCGRCAARQNGEDYRG